MSNIPRVRFAEYTDDWEQRKMMELAVFNPKADLPDIFEYVDLESVVGTEMLAHRTETKETAPSREQRLAQTGDLFYQTVRPYQKNNYLFEKLDKNYVFSTGYAQMRPSVDGRFLLSLVQNDGFVNTVLANCTGTSYPAINPNDLAKIKTYSPTDSQEKSLIGNFFKCVDNLITLYQHEFEKLVSLKSAFLNKMFPKNGSKVPELRFSGFTGDWKQRKLGDILQTLPFKTYLKSPEQDGKYEIIQQGNDPIIGYANGEPCKDYEDTVIFGDHTLSLYKPKSPFFVATDGVRIVKGFNDMDGNYLLPLLERNKPRSEGYKRYYSILADIDVFFTENHEEQSKIGECFSEIDNLINIHQRKLVKLKQFKQAMLHNMFV